MEVPHAQGGLVPGDGMGLMAQHYLRHQARQLLHDDHPSVHRPADAGLGHGLRGSCPRVKVVERAWEIARMWKTHAL